MSGALTQPSVSTQIIDALHRLSDRFRGAEADGTGDRHDDVGALVEKLLR